MLLFWKLESVLLLYFTMHKKIEKESQTFVRKSLRKAILRSSAAFNENMQQENLICTISINFEAHCIILTPVSQLSKLPSHFGLQDDSQSNFLWQVPVLQCLALIALYLDLNILI